MDSFGLYILLALAVGIGFLLGRREWSKAKRDTAPMMVQDYFEGLNYLLNEQPDLAIDTFIDSLSVDNDTVDTHLALGSLVRRRGEVDKAIRLHQNLLARPVLSKRNRAQAELELARDYLLAGLLGRAENLLLELVKHGELRAVASEHLLEIYQRERDWTKAEQVGRQMLGKNDRAVRNTLAHFLCEMAEEAIEAGDLQRAGELASRASDYDNKCFRVGLINAKIDFESKRYPSALKNLRRACEHRPELSSVAMPLYKMACEASGDTDSYVRFLETTVQKSPDIALVEELAAHMVERDGHHSARSFLGEQLLRRPSLRGLGRLIAEYEEADLGVPIEYVHVVRTFAELLADKAPLFRCGNCGFAGRTLLWQCPSCHTWDRCEPIHDLETEVAPPQAGVRGSAL